MNTQRTSTKPQEPVTLNKLVDLLHKLIEDQFFGEVAITFQNGRPHTIKVHRTYKVNDL